MSNCPDVCTAAKCEELEARIGALEQAIELLEASFEAHTSQDIPKAHDYQPQVNVNVYQDEDSGLLIVEVAVDGQTDEGQTAINNNTSVAFDIFEAGENQYVFKSTVNGETDEDTLTIPNTEIENVDPQVSVGVFEIGADQYGVSVTVGENQDQDSFTITHPDIEIPPQDNHVESNLKLSGSYRNDILTLTVADGESFDTEQIFIDADVINNFGGGGPVSCENKIDECCAQMLAAISTNFSEIQNNYNKIQEVENLIAIDVSATVCSDYTCEFPLDGDDEPIPTYAEAALVEKEFTGIGIAGLNERLKYLAANQDAMYKEVCKAVPPTVKVPLEQTLTRFCANNKLKTAEDFEDEQGFFNYLTEQAQQLLGSSILRSLVRKISFIPSAGLAGAAVTTTLSWATGFLLEKARAEQAQGLTNLCESQSDVVSIVASPKYVTNVDGKVLILHFVNDDNYPKRSNGGNYKPNQIPGAREEYDWELDFKDLRWAQGNQYGELELVGYKAKVSGWFADKAAGELFFDAVLKLTTADEKNRRYPDIKNPRTDIPDQVVRPYRAFISSVNEQGKAVCHVKYVPSLEENGTTN